MTYKSRFSITEAIDKYRTEAAEIKKQYDFNHVDPATRFWPSMASIEVKEVDAYGKVHDVVYGNCMRRNYYHCMGIIPTESIDARVQDAIDIGNIIEEMYGRFIGSLPDYDLIFPDIDGRKLKFNRNGVSGEVDILVRHKKTKEIFGVEMKSYDGARTAIHLVGYDKAKECYKSATPYIRKYLDKARKIKNPEFWSDPFPKEGHLLQSMLYLDEFSKDGLSLWKLVYIARDKGPRAEFDIELKADENGKKHLVLNGKEYPQWSVDKIYARYDKLAMYTKREEVPPRDFEPEYDSDTILDDPNQPNWIKEKVKGGIIHRDWQCIAENTRIRTNNGWLPIQDINTNHQVLTREGFKNVLMYGEQGIKSTKLVKPYILMNYEVTPDHKILTTTTKQGKRDKRIEQLKQNIGWRQIKDLDPNEKWWLVYIFDQSINKIRLSKDELKLIGNFVTEGNYRYKFGSPIPRGFNLTFGCHEREHVEEIKNICIELGATSVRIKDFIDERNPKTRQSIQMAVDGTEITSWLCQFVKGRWAHSKRFTDKIIQLSHEQQSYLLDIMIQQDGWAGKTKGKNTYVYTSVSKELILQVQEIRFRLGQISSVYSVQQNGFSDRMVYHNRFYPDATTNFGYKNPDVDNQYFIRLQSIESGREIMTYDLSIDGPQEFLTQGGLVHNCSYCPFTKQCLDDGPGTSGLI